MSRKYIREQIIQDFVFPNNEVSQYDTELVQDINNNSVSGTVTTLSATTIASTGITFSMTDSWSLNGAEPFIRNSNALSIYSVHMMGPTQLYYRPWRMVHTRGSTTTTLTTFSETNATFQVLPSQLGLTTFTTGTYYFEVRFIGHRSIYPVCLSLNITIP
jgi:hypothetical protein